MQPGAPGTPHLRPNAPTASALGTPHLERRIGLASAVSLNMMYMIGVGPFITLPLIVAAMGGSQALLGVAAGRADRGLRRAGVGGAGRGHAGGRRIVCVSARDLWARGRGAVRLVSLHFSARIQRAAVDGFRMHRVRGFCVVPVSRAAGSAVCCWPHGVHWTSVLAAGACALIVGMLYRDIRAILRTAWVLWAGVMAAMGIVLIRPDLRIFIRRCCNCRRTPSAFRRHFSRGWARQR